MWTRIFLKFFLVHRSNFYSNSSFNSSLKKHDGIAISHYVFKLVHLFLVHLLDCFGVISPSMLWTSNFGKLKVRMYFVVHGLDVLNICSSVGWMVLKSFAKVFISSYIWTSVPCNEGLAFSLCRPETFLVHEVADLNKNKNLNKSNMGIMDSHNTMYIT